MNFNELYPKKKEYYYLLMDIKTTAECNGFNYVIDKQKAKLLMRYINKKEKEIERLNNIIKHTDSWIDRTIEIIKQQPSEDDTWILERLNGIKQCSKGADKE